MQSYEMEKTFKMENVYVKFSSLSHRRRKGPKFLIPVRQPCLGNCCLINENELIGDHSWVTVHESPRPNESITNQNARGYF